MNKIPMKTSILFTTIVKLSSSENFSHQDINDQIEKQSKKDVHRCFDISNDVLNTYIGYDYKNTTIVISSDDKIVNDHKLKTVNLSSILSSTQLDKIHLYDGNIICIDDFQSFKSLSSIERHILSFCTSHGYMIPLNNDNEKKSYISELKKFFHIFNLTEDISSFSQLHKNSKMKINSMFSCFSSTFSSYLLNFSNCINNVSVSPQYYFVSNDYLYYLKHIFELQQLYIKMSACDMLDNLAYFYPPIVCASDNENDSMISLHKLSLFIYNDERISQLLQSSSFFKKFVSIFLYNINQKKEFFMPQCLIPLIFIWILLDKKVNIKVLYDYFHFNYASFGFNLDSVDLSPVKIVLMSFPYHKYPDAMINEFNKKREEYLNFKGKITSIALGKYGKRINEFKKYADLLTMNKFLTYNSKTFDISMISAAEKEPFELTNLSESDSEEKEIPSVNSIDVKVKEVNPIEEDENPPEIVELNEANVDPDDDDDYERFDDPCPSGGMQSIFEQLSDGDDSDDDNVDEVDSFNQKFNTDTIQIPDIILNEDVISKEDSDVNELDVNKLEDEPKQIEIKDSPLNKTQRVVEEQIENKDKIPVDVVDAFSFNEEIDEIFEDCTKEVCESDFKIEHELSLIAEEQVSIIDVNKKSEQSNYDYVTKGLMTVIFDPVGDGSCFYHCLSYLLNCQFDELKSKIITLINTEFDKINYIAKMNGFFENSVEIDIDLIEKSLNNKTFCENIHFIIGSLLLRRELVILFDNLMLCDYTNTFINSGKIYILNISNVHFVIVKDVKEEFFERKTYYGISDNVMIDYVENLRKENERKRMEEEHERQTIVSKLNDAREEIRIILDSQNINSDIDVDHVQNEKMTLSDIPHTSNESEVLTWTKDDEDSYDDIIPGQMPDTLVEVIPESRIKLVKDEDSNAITLSFLSPNDVNEYVIDSNSIKLIQSILRRNEELEDKINEHESQFEQLQILNNKLLERAEESERKIADATTKITMSQRIHQEMVELKEVLQTTNNELNSKYESTLSEVEKLKKELKDKQHNIEKLHSNIKNMTDKHDDEIFKQKRYYENIITEKRKDADLARQAGKEARDQNAILKTKIEDLELQQQRLSNDVNEFKKQKDELTDKWTSLETQVKKKIKIIARKDDELSAKNVEIKKLEHDLVILNEEKEKLLVNSKNSGILESKNEESIDDRIDYEPATCIQENDLIKASYESTVGILSNPSVSAIVKKRTMDKLGIRKISKGYEQSTGTIIYSNHLVSQDVINDDNYICVKTKCPCGVSKTIEEWVKTGYVMYDPFAIIIESNYICSCCVVKMTMANLLDNVASRPYIKELVMENIDFLKRYLH